MIAIYILLILIASPIFVGLLIYGPTGIDSCMGMIELSIGPGGKVTEVKSQGVFDIFSLLDRETVDKIKQLIDAVDPEKVKKIVDLIEVDDEGWINLKIKLGIKK